MLRSLSVWLLDIFTLAFGAVTLRGGHAPVGGGIRLTLHIYVLWIYVKTVLTFNALKRL